MNMIEKQAELGRTLFELNINTMQALFRTQQEDLQKYVELNADFGKRLPEIRDVQSFVELQREYGESLWTNLRESTQHQADIVRTAVEEAGSALRDAMSVSAEADAA